MTLLAIISDVHADVEALRAALGHLERLGCSRLVCAGDLVDYGPFAEETIGLMVEKRIACVRGNHDRWATSLGPSFFAAVQKGAAAARAATGAAAPEGEVPAPPADEPGLSASAVAYLESLPETLRLVEDDMRIVVCHARPESDMHGIYPDEPSTATIAKWLDDARADVLVVGHTHLPLVRRVGTRKLVVNPGTLLRTPLPGFEAPMVFDRRSGTFVPEEPVRGTFGVLDTRRLSFVVRRVSDGDEITAAAVRPGSR